MFLRSRSPLVCDLSLWMREIFSTLCSASAGAVSAIRSRRPFHRSKHTCYLNNTSMTQSANGSFRIPVLLRCARAPALATDKATTGESWISGAGCVRRMV